MKVLSSSASIFSWWFVHHALHVGKVHTDPPPHSAHTTWSEREPSQLKGCLTFSTLVPHRLYCHAIVPSLISLVFLAFQFRRQLVSVKEEIVLLV